MPSPLPPILLLMLCGVAGCQSVAPFVVLPETLADFDLITTSDQDATAFDMNDPQDQQRALALAEHFLVKGEIARTPSGSFVRIIDDRNRTFLGTLIHLDQETVQLEDCLGQEIALTNDGKRQAQRSYLSSQTFEVATIMGFTMFSPPPRGFDVATLGQHRGDSIVRAVVLKSGRILPWVELEESVSFSRNANRDELSGQIAAALPGSQVSLIDEHGRRINGIVIGTGPDEVELMNCLIQETIVAASDPPQYQTSHLPVQTFPASSLVSFAVVAPPPPDYAVPELGVDCEEYIVSEFILESGRRLSWGKPVNTDKSDECRSAWMGGRGKR